MGRWLVTGAGGMLGSDLVPLLADAGESHELEALALNGAAPAHLAAACAALAGDGHRGGAGSVLVQLSTDHVFAGDATAP